MAPTQELINVKLLLIGNSSVGKSSLLLRFSDKQWLPEDEASATIGVDFRVHKMEVKGRKVKMSIWDTAGQERFRTITASYYRGAQGVILGPSCSSSLRSPLTGTTVYDVSNRESFEALPRWLEELENYVPPEVVKIVVGNKLDKEYSRQVPTTEGASFAQRTGCLFVEASAKTAVGVTEAFSDVVARIIDTPALWGDEKPKASSSSKARAAAPRAPESMPGNIDLSQAHDEEEDGGMRVLAYFKYEFVSFYLSEGRRRRGLERLSFTLRTPRCLVSPSPNERAMLTYYRIN
ncbi:ras-domain-containing protein [Lactarius hatsudake]|nr:ras-domain-containing protein [Lactarius hatsudake]